MLAIVLPLLLFLQVLLPTARPFVLVRVRVLMLLVVGWLAGFGWLSSPSLIVLGRSGSDGRMVGMVGYHFGLSHGRTEMADK